ncbi:unnamed protein product [Closterium sp. Naga37s-1]|nr:unnamed protein product [Closterium sp. Naga37s-1]
MIVLQLLGAPNSATLQGAFLAASTSGTQLLSLPLHRPTTAPPPPAAAPPPLRIFSASCCRRRRSSSEIFAFFFSPWAHPTATNPFLRVAQLAITSILSPRPTPSPPFPPPPAAITPSSPADTTAASATPLSPPPPRRDPLSPPPPLAAAPDSALPAHPAAATPRRRLPVPPPRRHVAAFPPPRLLRRRLRILPPRRLVAACPSLRRDVSSSRSRRRACFSAACASRRRDASSPPARPSAATSRRRVPAAAPATASPAHPAAATPRRRLPVPPPRRLVVAFPPPRLLQRRLRILPPRRLVAACPSLRRDVTSPPPLPAAAPASAPSARPAAATARRPLPVPPPRPNIAACAFRHRDSSSPPCPSRRRDLTSPPAHSAAATARRHLPAPPPPPPPPRFRISASPPTAAPASASPTHFAAPSASPPARNFPRRNCNIVAPRFSRNCTLPSSSPYSSPPPLPLPLRPSLPRPACRRRPSFRRRSHFPAAFTFPPPQPACSRRSQHRRRGPSAVTCALRRRGQLAAAAPDFATASPSRRRTFAQPPPRSCFQVRGLVLPGEGGAREVTPRQVDLLPALSCHSPHSPRHHHSPPSSSCRSSRQPPVLAATLNAASPAAAPSSDHAAACVARLSSPADSAQQPVQSARAAASSASAELADHMCLLVHINGMAWLADVSTPCCPSSLLPHPMFLEPLLFQPAIHQAGPSFPSPPISIHYTRPSIPCCDVMCDSHSHPFYLLTQAFPLHATSLSHHPSPPQHQDAGVYRISPCAPPHPPAPAGAAPWVRGRGAGAVSVAPACTADGSEKPFAAVAAADRGREGWRAVERGVQGWAVEHVEAGMDGRMGERSAGREAHSDSDPDDDDDFYTEGVRGHGTPCPPRLTHAAGGQAASAAAVRAGEQWYVVERLCRVGPSEAGERWAAADGKQAAWGKAACEEEAQWQPLYRFSSWPHDTAHFLQCMRHASPLGGPRVAVRVCSEEEREVEGRGVIRDRHLLLLDGEGRVQSQQQLVTDEEFDAVVRGRFGIRLGADDVRAMPLVPREPPLGDVWLASEW